MRGGDDAGGDEVRGGGDGGDEGVEDGDEGRVERETNDKRAKN